MDIVADYGVTQRYREPNVGAVEQTSILKRVTLPEVRLLEDQSLTAALKQYPWLVVMNQDCDLEWDRKARFSSGPERAVSGSKLLLSVILCPAYPEYDVLAGVYLDGAKKWGSREKDILLGNRDDRYHRLPAGGLLTETLILDFKLNISVHPDYLYQWVSQNQSQVIAVLLPPFRDRLMQRFVNFLGRIAEPEEEPVQPEPP